MVKSRVEKWPAAMRDSARHSTVNSLASMVSMTRSLAASSMAAKFAALAGEIAPGSLQPVEPVAIDQHARNDVEPFIAGGAGDAGKVRHRLAVGENLLDHDVERPARRRAAAQLAG